VRRHRDKASRLKRLKVKLVLTLPLRQAVEQFACLPQSAFGLHQPLARFGFSDRATRFAQQPQGADYLGTDGAQFGLECHARSLHALPLHDQQQVVAHVAGEIALRNIEHAAPLG
jgi:hypothetical protein